MDQCSSTRVAYEIIVLNSVVKDLGLTNVSRKGSLARRFDVPFDEKLVCQNLSVIQICNFNQTTLHVCLLPQIILKQVICDKSGVGYYLD